jgi:CheY-like chemotaxis protein/HPt (histidine-containing phosphotransfer) domain-containing protein
VKQERLQRLKGLRVLAVDDVAINQTVIEQLLKSEGALVTLAANGRLGADAVLSAPAGQGFDVVLMDIQMPVMDGYEATRLIRSAPQLAQLPIIAVTANVLDADRARCLEAGMNHHVGKPYDLDELVAVICSLTGRQRAVPDAIPALPQPGTAHSSAAVVTAQPMHAYWIRATALQIVPDLVTLLKQGVLLQVLDSVESLESLLAAGAPAGLLVLDRATVTSAALHASGRSSNGASMKVMPMIALADAPTEEEMLACRRAGVVDMVPHQFALKYLPEIGKRYLDEQGVPRVDLHQNIAAIDSRRAMAHMQADAVFFGSLLRAFFDELPGRTKQFQDDWSGNAQQLKHHSHSLKGLARTLGLHELAEVAVQIEVQGAQGASPDAALLTQLEGELESAGFQILRWLHMHQDAAGAQP